MSTSTELAFENTPAAGETAPELGWSAERLVAGWLQSRGYPVRRMPTNSSPYDLLVNHSVWESLNRKSYGAFARPMIESNTQSDAWEFSPLYIQGSRNALTLCSLHQIAIGCHVHDIDHWLENYKVIGKSEGYSKEQIAEYGEYLQLMAATAKRLSAKSEAGH